MSPLILRLAFWALILQGSGCGESPSPDSLAQDVNVRSADNVTELSKTDSIVSTTNSAEVTQGNERSVARTGMGDLDQQLSLLEILTKNLTEAMDRFQRLKVQIESECSSAIRTNRYYLDSQNSTTQVMSTEEDSLQRQMKSLNNSLTQNNYRSLHNNALIKGDTAQNDALAQSLNGTVDWVLTVQKVQNGNQKEAARLGEGMISLLNQFNASHTISRNTLKSLQSKFSDCQQKVANKPALAEFNSKPAIRKEVDPADAEYLGINWSK